MSSIIGLSVGGCGSRIIDEFYAGIQSESMESEYNNVFFSMFIDFGYYYKIFECKRII